MFPIYIGHKIIITIKYLIFFSENQKKICRQVENINSIPTFDSWLIKYQQNLYTRGTDSETNTKNFQLNYQYRNLPSLAPIANFDKLKNITLNTWS